MLLLPRASPLAQRSLAGLRSFSASAGPSKASQVRMLLVGSPVSTTTPASRSAQSHDLTPSPPLPLLIARQGSGKGTLSTLLSQSYPSISTISAGDLLRTHIQQGTPLGKEAEAVVAKGGLMPDPTMMQMVGGEVRERGEGNWLLDGFPRTDGQARLLDAALEEQGKPLNLVVNLDVPEEVILARILGELTG